MREPILFSAAGPVRLQSTSAPRALVPGDRVSLQRPAAVKTAAAFVLEPVGRLERRGLGVGL